MQHPTESKAHMQALSVWIDCKRDDADRELTLRVDDTNRMSISVNGSDVLDLEAFDEMIPTDACIKIRDFLNYCFPPKAL